MYGGGGKQGHFEIPNEFVKALGRSLNLQCDYAVTTGNILMNNKDLSVRHM
ncbi:hypothetical protein UNDYM_3054 [Undibacterium sp. YM2]|nr:hypothetical protein UNDYM_3054 [Undibacterium sp. YM2]